MAPRALLSISAGLLLGGCGPLGFETQVTDKEPFSPPPVYATWWASTEACAGRTGRFELITWYLASSITGDRAVARGRWSPPHEIVIVRGFEDDERTVRHEMLHDLLRGDAEHRSPEWSACGLLFEGG
jgi:hypothetical protein